MKLDLKENKQHRLIAIAVLGSLLGVAILVIAGVSYAYAYEDRFFPGTRVANTALGGMSYEEGLALINSQADTLIEEGARITINDTTRTIPLRTVSPDDPDLNRDLVILNVQPAVQAAFDRGHTGSLPHRAWNMIRVGLERPNQEVQIETDRAAIESSLLETFEEYYNPAVEPSYNISVESGNWVVEVVPGTSGRAFDLDRAVEAFTLMMANLNNETVTIAVIDEVPQISDAQAEALTSRAVRVIEEAPHALAYELNEVETYDYQIDTQDLMEYLEPELHNNSVQLGLPEDFPLFATIQEEINVAAQDARFQMEDDRVQEFEPSKNGREVNLLSTRQAIAEQFAAVQAEASDEGDQEEQDEPAAIAITVDTIEPDITTAEVNDLGITEILGVGYSDFAGSPSNRIANIRHGLSKLDGMLIAPGEQVSLIDELKPFTVSDGYLPELVIKGDDIIPEVGGGLCQIGSTTFRAVMNSGLSVDERRNHSLVVNYYNDLTNGNPGTDATLYDPAPDFKFTNDTDHHILLDTHLNMETKILSFTFWGTSDGRKGYYTPPVVQNWIGTGPAQITYTTELPPGVRRCQGAHPGANTSFSYYVERPDGEVEETVYESHYRPLPTICLVGIGESQSVDDDGNLVEAPEPTTEPEETAPVEAE